MIPRILLTISTLVVGFLCTASVGLAQEDVVDPCLQNLQMIGTVECLTDSGGSFTATVKITNPCDHAVEVGLAIEHEGSPGVDGPWDEYTWQVFQPATLPAGESVVYQGGSAEHPEKAWYQFMAYLLDSQGRRAKEIRINEPARVCYPVDPAIAELIPPTPIPVPTRTPKPGEVAALSITSDNSLLGATVNTVFPFFVPFLLGGIVAVIDEVVGFRRRLKRGDYGRIWWAWLVGMVSGGITLAVATMAGLIGAAIVGAVAALTNTEKLGGASVQSAALPKYLAFIVTAVVAGAIMGSVAGVVQWLILRPISRHQLGEWVLYNALCWSLSLAVSLVLAVVFAMLGGMFWLYGGVVVAGAVAGWVISHKLIQPALALSLWGRDDH